MGLVSVSESSPRLPGETPLRGRTPSVPPPLETPKIPETSLGLIRPISSQPIPAEQPSRGRAWALAGAFQLPRKCGETWKKMGGCKIKKGNSQFKMNGSRILSVLSVFRSPVLIAQLDIHKKFHCI